MKESILKTKSYAFAISLVKCSQLLISEKKEYVLSKQLLRSRTAIGALIPEAEFAQSKADFVHKMSISLKEANETQYWLNLLKDTNYMEIKNHELLINQCKELTAMLVSSIKTTKSRM